MRGQCLCCILCRYNCFMYFLKTCHEVQLHFILCQLNGRLFYRFIVVLREYASFEACFLMSKFFATLVGLFTCAKVFIICIKHFLYIICKRGCKLFYIYLRKISIESHNSKSIVYTPSIKIIIQLVLYMHMFEVIEHATSTQQIQEQYHLVKVCYYFCYRYDTNKSFIVNL